MMQKIILVFLITVCFSYSTYAQLKKGDLLLGGTIAFASLKYDDASLYTQESKTNVGNFKISIGKALKENSVFGLEINYQPYSTNNYYAGYLIPLLDYTSNSFGADIYYRLYKNLGNNFSLFGQASAGYSGSNLSGKDSTGKKYLSGTESNIFLSFFPGIAYRISNKFFLELSIPQLFIANYNTSKTTIESQSPVKSDNFLIGTSLNGGALDAIGIGFRLIL